MTRFCPSPASADGGDSRAPGFKHAFWGFTPEGVEVVVTDINEDARISLSFGAAAVAGSEAFVTLAAAAAAAVDPAVDAAGAAAELDEEAARPLRAWAPGSDAWSIRADLRTFSLWLFRACSKSRARPNATGQCERGKLERRGQREDLGYCGSRIGWVLTLHEEEIRCDKRERSVP